MSLEIEGIKIKTGRKSKIQLSKFVDSLLYRIVIFYGPPGSGKSTFLCRLARILRAYSSRPAKIFWTDPLMMKKKRSLAPWLRKVANADCVFKKYPWEVTYELRRLKASDYCAIIIDSVSGMYERVGTQPPRLYQEMKNWMNDVSSRIVDLIDYGGLLTTIFVLHSTSMFQGDFYGEKDKPNISWQTVKNVEIVLKGWLEVHEAKSKREKNYYIKYVFHRTDPWEENYEGMTLTHDDFLGQTYEDLLKAVGPPPSKKEGE